MNIANKFTVLRIILVPVFMVSLLMLKTENILPLLIFSVAAITDAIDGHLARSRNLVTTFGKFLDPIADKLLSISAFVLFIELNLVPAWGVFLIIAREIIISCFRIIAASNNVTIAASIFGKVKTISQFSAIILFLLNLKNIAIVLFYICVIFTVMSGIDYIIKNIDVLDIENI